MGGNIPSGIPELLVGYYPSFYDDMWIAQRNAANREERDKLLRLVGIRPARQSLFAPARFESRIPRFFRPAKRSRGACGIY